MRMERLTTSLRTLRLAGSCSVAVHGSRFECERAGAVWTAATRVVRNTNEAREQAEFYPFNEGSEEGAREALVETYLDDFDLDGAMHAGVMEPAMDDASCSDGTSTTSTACENAGGTWRGREIRW